MKMNLKNIIFILGVLFLGSSCENFWMYILKEKLQAKNY